jgi:hypothetical protein
MRCPKSIITRLSLDFLERFTYWKGLGGGPLFDEDARVADAMLLLNEQWIQEQQNGEIKE